jgi:hypothetical protein
LFSCAIFCRDQTICQVGGESPEATEQARRLMVKASRRSNLQPAATRNNRHTR